MKTVNVFLILFFSRIFKSAIAQEEIQYPHKIWLYEENKPLAEKGYLYALSDTFIQLASVKYYPLQSEFLKEIKIADIEYIRVRQKASIWKGAVFGTLLGAVAGYAVFNSGMSSVDKYRYDIIDKNDLLIIGTSIGAFSGAALGALIGAYKVKIPINGQKAKYLKQKNRLETYLLKSD